MFNLDILLKSEYRLSFVNALKQSFQNNESFSSVGKPKKYHLFLLIESGKVEYLLKNGVKLTANSGDTVYIPAGCEYSCKFFKTNESVAVTLGVNFNLYSENGKVLQNNEIYIFNSQSLKTVIYEIERLSFSFNQIKNKFNAELYNAFNIISDEYFKFERFNADFLIIKNGVEYLHKYFYENFDINYLATLSNVSEVYFRRLFKKMFGYPPAEYRIKLRINKACDYLKYTQLPVHQIAEELGFIDAAYFTKIFKQERGITPLQYRNS